jgi:hypothetical protein
MLAIMTASAKVVHLVDLEVHLKLTRAQSHPRHGRTRREPHRVIPTENGMEELIRTSMPCADGYPAGFVRTPEDETGVRSRA